MRSQRKFGEFYFVVTDFRSLFERQKSVNCPTMLIFIRIPFLTNKSLQILHLHKQLV